MARALRWMPAVAAVGAWAGGCTMAPWYMGVPLDGRPFISEPSAAPGPRRLRAEAAAERRAGHRVTELRALLELERITGLDEFERERLISLLEGRVAEWTRLGRDEARAADVRRLQGLGVIAAPTVAEAAGPCGPPCRFEDWALGAPAVASRLPRGPQRWDVLRPPVDTASWKRLADLAVEEDPTSADALELGAYVAGLRGEWGAAERLVTDMIYFTPDRGGGLERAALLWERLAQPRRMCAAWNRLARWRDDPADPAWQRVLACARRNSRAADADAVSRYLEPVARR